MTELFLAYHCAPALAGIKPANIAACQKAYMPNIHSDIETLNRQLNGKDIYIEPICECEKRVLVMVYRKRRLEAQLQSCKNRAFLSQFGYLETGNMANDIHRLKERLQSEGFPHEIGVFLGYPLWDIYCFIHHRDEGCLLSGEWKVYHNAAYAQKLFGRYQSCRAALVKKIADGRSLAQVFCAA